MCLKCLAGYPHPWHDNGDWNEDFEVTDEMQPPSIEGSSYE